MSHFTSIAEEAELLFANFYNLFLEIKQTLKLQ